MTLVVAAAIEIAGVVPPDDTTGAEPVTEVTVPEVGVVHVGVAAPALVSTWPEDPAALTASAGPVP